MATPEPSSVPVEPTEQGAPPRVRPADDGLGHIQARNGAEVTSEELADWERTGELPASLEARLAASDCRAKK